jgi:hypothetical protein
MGPGTKPEPLPANSAKAPFVYGGDILYCLSNINAAYNTYVAKIHAWTAQLGWCLALLTDACVADRHGSSQTVWKCHLSIRGILFPCCLIRQCQLGYAHMYEAITSMKCTVLLMPPPPSKDAYAVVRHGRWPLLSNGEERRGVPFISAGNINSQHCYLI